MKYIHKTIILLTIGFSLISCSQNNSDVKKLETKAFETLKSMGSLSYDAYIKKYILLENYKALAKKTALDDDYRNEILAITKADWDFYRTSEYQDIKEIGSSNNIDWEKITIIDFNYTTNKDYGFDWLEAEFYFKYNDEFYELRVYAIHDSKDYQFFSLKV